MNSAPSLTIEFNPETWTPTAYLNGATDIETARLKEIADKMLEAIREQRP